MNIQMEVQKIHHQFGVTEKANYEIQKLFDKAIKDSAYQILDNIGSDNIANCVENWWNNLTNDQKRNYEANAITNDYLDIEGMYKKYVLRIK